MNNEKKKMLIMAIAVFIICGIIFGAGTYFLFRSDKKTEEAGTTKTSQEIINEVLQTPYISETCYDGSNAIDPSLYEKPFAMGNNYHSNRTLYNDMGEEFLTDKEILAKEYVTLLYNINYNHLIKDPNTFIDTFNTYYNSNVLFTTAEADVTTGYYAEEIIDTYVQNKAQIEADFITDKSLVFYNNGVIYVRGYIKYTVYAYEDIESLREELKNPTLELGETYYLMTHVMLVASAEDSSKYTVLGLEY